jgi:hypothetical protein
VAGDCNRELLLAESWILVRGLGCLSKLVKEFCLVNDDYPVVLDNESAPVADMKLDLKPEVRGGLFKELVCVEN